MSESIVFRVHFDVKHYQAVLYDLPDPGLELWLFDGTPRADTWSVQPVAVDKPRLMRPDIWHLVGAAVLVFELEVVELLEPFVSSAGELLPLDLVPSNQRLLALNILEDIDVLDPQSYSETELRLVPNFLEHRLPESGLFKIPQVDTADIFVLERDDDEDSFRGRIERHNLRGITLDPVWSSTNGPAPIDLIWSGFPNFQDG